MAKDRDSAVRRAAKYLALEIVAGRYLTTNEKHLVKGAKKQFERFILNGSATNPDLPEELIPEVLEERLAQGKEPDLPGLAEYYASDNASLKEQADAVYESVIQLAKADGHTGNNARAMMQGEEWEAFMAARQILFMAEGLSEPDRKERKARKRVHIIGDLLEPALSEINAHAGSPGDEQAIATALHQGQAILLKAKAADVPDIKPWIKKIGDALVLLAAEAKKEDSPLSARFKLQLQQLQAAQRELEGLPPEPEQKR